MKRFGVTDYDNYWESRFADKHYQFTDVHRKIIKTAREILGTRKARVLDCGVGPGHVFRVLSDYYDTFGIEISEKAFELYDFDTNNITIGDMNNGLPDYPEKMDLVIASRIVHHMEDPALFVSRVRDVITSGGWFMGIVPNICYYHHRLKFLIGKFPPISRAHVNFQTGPDFERMVTGEGFRLNKLTTPKTTIRAKLRPTLFSQDLIYVFQKR
jgi:SAM-dependent methyltransferase